MAAAEPVLAVGALDTKTKTVTDGRSRGTSSVSFGRKGVS
jgi:hypothetical protein